MRNALVRLGLFESFSPLDLDARIQQMLAAMVAGGSLLALIFGAFVLPPGSRSRGPFVFFGVMAAYFCSLGLAGVVRIVTSPSPEPLDFIGPFICVVLPLVIIGALALRVARRSLRPSQLRDSILAQGTVRSVRYLPGRKRVWIA
jgi:hypothetical protein